MNKIKRRKGANKESVTLFECMTMRTGIPRAWFAVRAADLVPSKS